jgi:hypothetical protein
MTIEEMKLIYDSCPTIAEAAKKIGIAKYKLSRIRVDQNWKKKVNPTKGRTPRHWGHSVYDAITTSYSGGIKHNV